MQFYEEQSEREFQDG